MKRKLLSLVAILAIGISSLSAQTRNCAAHDKYQEQLSNPKYEHQMQLIEQHTEQYVQQIQNARATGRLAADGETVIIPVVVHVLYRTNSENISAAQIQSQIAVLNEDFSATNSDYGNIPSEFASVASGNTNIIFEMATVDPDGNPTTGITRKYDSRSSWGTNDAMKKSSQGGVDAWPTGDYLNMWVCNIGGGILGYAQFPGGDPSTDGVVMGPNYFGSSDYGSNFYLSAPYDKGRTTTHEVGHWLNLRHIWGDGPCQTDYVDDTPSAVNSNSGCPSHPSSSCFSNDMFMNYMDYVNDACMYMFSAGQEDRMRATFFGTSAPRASFIADQDTTGSGGGGNNGGGNNGGGTACTDTEVILSLTTDNYGSETSWDLKDDAGSTIASGSGLANNTSYSDTFCLADGDYTFTIYDSYGDGMCCGYGSGSYSLDEGSTNHASGASFGSSEATDFTINGGGSGGGGTGGGGTDPAPNGYCASAGNNSSDEYINRVRIGSIDNTSGNDGGYGDYTSISTSMNAGSSQTITINPTWPGLFASYAEGYAVFIDYNRDGDFDDAGELAYTRAATTSSTVTGSFTVPSNVSDGYARMRVSMKYNGIPSACESFAYGEVEDYEVLLSSSARLNKLDVESSMSLFPNPAQGRLQLRLVSSDREPVQVNMMNLQGQVIFSKQYELTQNENLIELDLSRFAKGVYMVRVQGAAIDLTERLVIQ